MEESLTLRQLVRKIQAVRTETTVLDHTQEQYYCKMLRHLTTAFDMACGDPSQLGGSHPGEAAAVESVNIADLFIKLIEYCHAHGLNSEEIINARLKNYVHFHMLGKAVEKPGTKDNEAWTNLETNVAAAMERVNAKVGDPLDA